MSLRVAIIDDDPSYCAQLAEQLRTRGIEVVGMAHDGSSGLALLSRTQPDAAILNLILPKTDGFALLERLPKYCHTRIIVVSELAQPAFAATALRLGAHAHASKPCDPDTLTKLLRAPAHSSPHRASPSLYPKLLDVFATSLHRQKF